MTELVYQCASDECDRRVRRYNNEPEKDCIDCGETDWEMVDR